MKQNERYNFTVEVETAFMEEHSIPEDKRFVFIYTISITNNGSVAGTLVRRHWIITDANNNRQEVHGDGVVGEQPCINPGQTYQYTSGAVIETPVGFMEGRYDFVADDGFEFDSPIPPFSLATPNTLH
ncbi:MAG: Co2+/Mg2+ efflux protein ApaG [Gammaproteobacteria bacterium]